jgi:hypothetical protein
LPDALSTQGSIEERKIVRPLLTRPWSEQDVSTLKKMWGTGLPTRLIAIRLRRSMKAVSKKARQLNLGSLRTSVEARLPH